MAGETIFDTHSQTNGSENGYRNGLVARQALLAQGRQFAAKPGARWRDTGIDVISTSDLNRAVERRR